MIGIKGAYGQGNFGDDALMVAAVQAIERTYPNQPYTLICNPAGYIQNLLPGVTITPPRSSYRNSIDRLIYGGGTQFSSFPLTAPKGPATTVFKMLNQARTAYPSFNSAYTHTLKKIRQERTIPTAALGIGLGPFIPGCNREQTAKWLFRNMACISARDTSTFDRCKAWGCKNLTLGTDLCFLSGLFKPIEHPPSISQNPSCCRIGIIPRDWPHTNEGDAYADSLLEVTRHLRNEGRSVNFLLFAPTYDRKWIDRLHTHDEPFISWNPETQALQSFMDQLASYDLIISARYHGAIFASLVGKPVICIEVEQKLTLIDEVLGQGSRLWQYPFSAHDALKAVADLETNLLSASQCVSNIRNQQRQLADQMVSLLPTS